MNEMSGSSPGTNTSSRSLYRRMGKRALDIALVAVMLPFIAPGMIIIGFLVHLVMGSPVLFGQRRPGRNGESFVILKFRTMTDARDGDGELLSDTLRLTRFGRFLRSTSLDELPELINVLRGEMSLVGPRPLLVEYLDRYSSEQRRRHEVRPGITGLAQISGRQSLRFSKRLALDVWYVDHFCFSLDAKILAMTIPRTVFSKGAIHGQDVRDVDDVGFSSK